MGNTPNRYYPIPDPGDAIHPSVRDSLMAIDTDVDSLIGAGVFEANHGPYNAIPNDTGITDNGARIASCIADAVTWSLANNKQKVAVLLDPGIYTIADALSTANSARAQIPFPKVAFANGGVHLTIACKSPWTGHSIPGWLSSTQAGASVVLASTLTGQSQTGSGSPFIMGGPDLVNGTDMQTNPSWMAVHLKGISFRVPANPTIGGFNGAMIAKVVLQDFRVHAQAPDTSAWPTAYVEPTNPTGIANLMPMNNLEGGDYLGMCEAAGLYGGLAISELGNAQGPLFVYSCKAGLNIQAPWYHTAIIQHYIDVRNVYGLASVDPTSGLVAIPNGLAVTNRTNIKINLWDTEDADSVWNARVAHIYNDAASRLSGVFQHSRVIQNVGNTGGITLPAPHHARNLRFIDLLSPAHTPDLIYDRLFGSAQALTTRRPQVNQGASWVLPGVSGSQTHTDFNVQSGGGAIGSTSGNNLTVIESNASDIVVSVLGRFSNVSGGSMGLVFRYQDKDHFWLLEWVASTGVATVYEKTAADAFTSRGTTTITPTAVVFYTLCVVLSGTSIKVYANGVQVGSSITSSSYQTATSHGIFAGNQTALLTEFRITSI